MALLILAACSGTGKSTLVKGLLARHPRLRLSVSHTTRAPRPGEEDGVAYHFVTRDAFEALAAEGAFVERADIHEELTRLRAHVAHLCALLASGAPEGVGRRCDFLCQELLREANTATSKVSDLEVTRLAVDLKAEIERLREQVQNVE